MPREKRCQERLDGKKEELPRENRCQENRVEKSSRMHFTWHAQYVVKVECEFLWQAQ